MIHPSMRRKKPIARTARPRPRRKGKIASLKAECDKLFSLYIRKRDGKCQVCGDTERLQCAHGFSRRYHNTRWDELNAFALCQGCHFSLTFDPLAWEGWLMHRLGRDYETLRTRALMVGTRPDHRAILVWLKSVSAGTKEE